MKGFSEKETKELILMASDATEKNEGLTSAFKKFASVSGRAQGSVRNHYYKTLKESENDGELMKKLGITDRLKPALIEEFTKDEEITLLSEIFKRVTLGDSVRGAILKMSNGNEKLSLRYQNKYRNLLKSNSPCIDEAIARVKEQTGVCIDVRQKVQNKDTEYQKLEREINRMLDRLLRSVREENERLKRKTLNLERENGKLKSVVSKTMRDKNFTREYFENLAIKNVE